MHSLIQREWEKTLKTKKDIEIIWNNTNVDG